MSGAALAGERLYYIEEFADEIVPCEPTLAGWAAWLSMPDEEWGRDAAASDGASFDATVLTLDDDIIATRTLVGWLFSRDPSAADFLAIRYAEGLGWDADGIISGEDMEHALREWLSENSAFCEDVEFVAVGTNEAPVRLTYRAGRPPLMTAEVVQ